jgi:hypothetical protein
MWDLFPAVEEVPLPPGYSPSGGGEVESGKEEKET